MSRVDRRCAGQRRGEGGCLCVFATTLAHPCTAYSCIHNLNATAAHCKTCKRGHFMAFLKTRRHCEALRTLAAFTHTQAHTHCFECLINAPEQHAKQRSMPVRWCPGQSGPS